MSSAAPKEASPDMNKPSNYRQRAKTNSIFGWLTFTPVVLIFAALFILLGSIASNTLSWQIIEPTTSGKSFAFGEGMFNGKAIFFKDLKAQGVEDTEINDTLNNPESYRKYQLRNRVQLMLSTPEGSMRWMVFSIRDDLVENFSFWQGLFNKKALQAKVEEGQVLVLNPWLDASFFQLNASRNPMTSGLKGAVAGTFWVMLLVILVIVPVGVGAAIYLEEYAPKNFLSKLLEINIRNLAGIPSIVYGILGLTLFVRLAKWGPTVIAASLTLSLLVLPIVVIAARESIRAVPSSLRQASYGLGATKWQTVFKVVLPYATPGIATGVLLAVARAIGETAPLLLVGAAAFIVTLPTGLLSEYTVIPVQLYMWTSENDPEFQNVAAAAIVFLMAVLLIFNLLVSQVRKRFTAK